MFSVLVSAIVLSATPARAQDPPDPSDTDGVDQAPAHISVLDGAASLERDGRVDESPSNIPLLAGDRLVTREGRIEILFGDGSVLHVDHFTRVDLQSDALLRLLEGRVRLTVARGAPVQYRIDTPSGWVRIAEPGDYRIALLAPGGGRLDAELFVLRGSAELGNDSGTTVVRAGERAVTLNGAMPSYAHPYNVAYWDAFERWVEDRRQARLAVTSSQYLPSELDQYGGTFDSYGTWQHDVSYGYVWYPRVSHGWRPYYKGRWGYYRPYGWTWIGYDPWAWPTHHYGRWGFSGHSWFWIPSRRWGPAWVSWSYAPGFVGWCPRGWYGGPVIGLGINVVSGFNPWNAWTVVPRHRCGRIGRTSRYPAASRCTRSDAIARCLVARRCPARSRRCRGCARRWSSRMLRSVAHGKDSKMEASHVRGSIATWPLPARARRSRPLRAAGAGAAYGMPASAGRCPTGRLFLRQ
jgi:FecR protein